MGLEDTVKGQMLSKIQSKNCYPHNQNERINNVIWYKESSYKKGNKNASSIIEQCLSTASKSKKNLPGSPDFIIDTKNFYIVIEAKAIDKNGHMHSRFLDVSDYCINGYDENFFYYSAIDDVLWYSEHLNSEKDVIAIACSGEGTDETFKLTSFYLQKNKELSTIKLIEDGNLYNTFMDIEGYERKISELNGELEKTYEEVYDELRIYASESAAFMYKVGVDDADRLGLVSVIVLALSNEDSNLYEAVKKSSDDMVISSVMIEDALLSNDLSKPGVIVKDRLPVEKATTLREYIYKVLRTSKLTNDISSLLSSEDKKGWDDKHKKNNLFGKGGNTILSRLTISLYENIICKCDKYKDTGIDIMGAFYSLFLMFYASDKKKGVVLTPSHTTKLFCDIAEFYLNKKLTEKTRILDICTGSGGFLIAALNRIDSNIDADLSKSEQEKSEAKEKAREYCLLGDELAPNMFTLAYANMRFHGDGKSTLFNLNGLEKEEKFYKNGNKMLTMASALRKVYDPDNKFSDMGCFELFKLQGADVGMINPPYGKDFNEFDFIDAMLCYLKTEGIGIAIVPTSNQAASKNADKIAILENHSLLASILMPNELFKNISNSGATVGTCILVFRAHIPHSKFLASGGKTYLADWREDGFKMVNKHGRFEEDNKWYDSNQGYRKLYLDDLRKSVNGDVRKQNTLKKAYYKSFTDEIPTDKNGVPLDIIDCPEVHMISSSVFQKDIHNGGIKSTMVSINENPQEIKYQKTDKDGNLKYKKRHIKVDAIDENGNKIPKGRTNKKGEFKQSINKKTGELEWQKITVEIKEPEMESVVIYDNMDWNILDYVKTDYSDLSDDDFIKTLLDYNIFSYMKENGLLFEDD